MLLADDSIPSDVIAQLESIGHKFNVNEIAQLEVINIARKQDDDVTGSSDVRVVSDNAGAVLF